MAEATVAEVGPGGPAARSGGSAPDRPRERIVTAGHRLLGDCGLDGLTVRAVLAAAGLNRRMFYERFADKDALVLAIFTYAIERLAEDCRAQTLGMAEPLQRLRFIVDYIAADDAAEDEVAAVRARRGAALCREHMRLAEARPVELGRALRPLLDLICEQLAEGVARGEVRPDDPRQLAALFYNLVSTTVHAELLAQDAGVEPPSDRKRLADRIWAFCQGGLRPDAGRRPLQ